MKLVFFVAALLYGRFCIQCFNIDTKFPIIYDRPVQSLPGRNSYFGFSLLLNNTWVQIGAPRANSTILGDRVMEPGVVYRCKIFGTCTEVELDKNVNQLRDDNPLVWDLKNYSWIGVAMDMERGPQGKVVICGHRWKNQQNLSRKSENRKNVVKYAMSGICYFSQYEKEFILKFKYILPPETYSQGPIALHGAHYEDLYHKSQIGMSVYLAPPSKDSIALLIGAPGAARYWSGGVVEYTGKLKEAPSMRHDTEIKEFSDFLNIGFIDEFILPNITQFDYFGYQVAAGYFFSNEELLHVASAPRAYDLKGLVAIYYVRDRTGPVLIDVKKGQSFGEYFGSSLAVADVTGDGFDDLIIGAPFFSIHGDEGCIYVFTKLGVYPYTPTVQNILQEKERKTGFSVGGRFGTSMASLGDIDQDGREDIAVGAPYEESGVIYIYNGISNGLSSEPSQRIAARDIHESLRGFGISISRPADIDGNNFGDIAVGSYLSELVILLRSHPVIELHALLRTRVKQLNVNHTSFIVNACIYYNGSVNVPKNIEVVRKLDVDSKFHRFHSIPEKSLRLAKQEEYYCEEISIKEKKNKNDPFLLNNIIIVLSARLKHQENIETKVLWVDAKKGDDKFCSSCPVVRKIYSDEIIFTYIRDCGDDDVCDSYAQLHCQLLHNGSLLNREMGFTIGSYPILQLIIHVRNQGDPLFTPQLRVTTPEEIEFGLISPACKNVPESHAGVSCNLGYIGNEEGKSVNITLDLSSFETLKSKPDPLESFNINVRLFKNSYEDSSESNIQCNMKVNLFKEADVNISRKYFKDIHFSKSERKVSTLIHIYQISHVGTSPIQEVQTFLHVPVEWRGLNSSIQFSTPSVVAQQNGEPIFCNPVETNLTFHQHLYQYNIRPDDDDNSKNANVFHVNCSSLKIKCKTWKCNFFEFQKNTIARIKVTVGLNISKLESAMGNRNIIYFSTRGHAEMIESNNTRHTDIMTYQDITISSSAIGTINSETMPMWSIVILCIIAGIVVLAIIVIVLAKIGFFKREQKKALQALKAQNCSQQ